MPASKSLTTKEVARLCRVSDATVKRWEESGVLLSERTNGGHRRFRAEEIARFQRDSGLGQKTCHGDESAQTAVTRRRTKKSHSTSSLFHSLVAGREEEASSLIINAFMHGTSLTQIFDDLIRDAMHQVGELWFSGELTIAQEHLATRAALNAIQKLRSVIPIAKPTGMLAMCCSLEGDHHEMSTHLAQIVLESLGWEVMNFGANMPLYSLTEEVLHHSPELVILSSTLMNDVERITRDYREFRAKIAKLKVSVVIGGHAFRDERIRNRFAYELYADKFEAVAEFSNEVMKTKALETEK